MNNNNSNNDGEKMGREMREALTPPVGKIFIFAVILSWIGYAFDKWHFKNKLVKHINKYLDETALPYDVNEEAERIRNFYKGAMGQYCPTCEDNIPGEYRRCPICNTWLRDEWNESDFRNGLPKPGTPKYDYYSKDAWDKMRGFTYEIQYQPHKSLKECDLSRKG